MLNRWNFLKTGFYEGIIIACYAGAFFAHPVPTGSSATGGQQDCAFRAGSSHTKIDRCIIDPRASDNGTFALIAKRARAFFISNLLERSQGQSRTSKAWA